MKDGKTVTMKGREQVGYDLSSMKTREQAKYDFLKAKRKDAAKNEYDIIKMLASNGEQTTEQISLKMKTKTGHKHWIVAKTRIDSLEQRGFVRVYRRERKKQGGGKKTFYVLRFKGLVGYFASIYGDIIYDYLESKSKKPLDIHEYAKDILHIIEMYGRILDYPIFKNWDFFIGHWNDYSYIWLLLGSLVSYADEPVWNNETGRPLAREEIEDYYRQTLSYKFFSLMIFDSRITVKPDTTFDSTIVDFMTKVLAKKEKKLNVENERFEKLKRLIKAK